MPSSPSDQPVVLSTNTSPTHAFSKPPTSTSSQPGILLVANHGIQNDSHAGTEVQHLSRIHLRDSDGNRLPNLRQVHFMHSEILEQHDLKAGDLGENITTKGIDLLGLGVGDRLTFVAADSESAEGEDGKAPCVVITGLRNPCQQIEKFQKGLLAKFVERNGKGVVVKRKAGVMGTVEVGGWVRPGMRIVVKKAEGDYVELGPV